MVEHDDMVAAVLKQLDDLGIADNTIVVYGTDNGAETGTWPDGGTTPFHGEKGTTWEGGVRVPGIAYWKGMIAPGRVSDEVFDLMDLFNTAVNLAGANAKLPKKIAANPHPLPSTNTYIKRKKAGR
jgi:arylsulfatase